MSEVNEFALRVGRDDNNHIYVFSLKTENAARLTFAGIGGSLLLGWCRPGRKIENIFVW